MHHFHGSPNEILSLTWFSCPALKYIFPQRAIKFLHLLQWGLSADGITMTVDCKRGKMLFPVSSPMCSCRAPPSRHGSLFAVTCPSSFTPWACFFKDCFFLSSLSCYLICRRGRWPGSMLGIIKFAFMPLHFLQNECELVEILHKRTPHTPESSLLGCLLQITSPYPRHADCSRVLAWCSFCFFHLNKSILFLTCAVSLFALKK